MSLSVFPFNFDENIHGGERVGYSGHGSERCNTSFDDGYNRLNRSCDDGYKGGDRIVDGGICGSRSKDTSHFYNRNMEKNYQC